MSKKVWQHSLTFLNISWETLCSNNNVMPFLKNRQDIKLDTKSTIDWILLLNRHKEMGFDYCPIHVKHSISFLAIFINLNLQAVTTTTRHQSQLFWDQPVWIFSSSYVTLLRTKKKVNNLSFAISCWLIFILKKNVPKNT